MARSKKNIRKTKRRIRKPAECMYCKQKMQPNYTDIDTLKRFTTERGKIVGKMYSGLCQKHQRMLTKAVKRARFLALLPFIVRPS